MCAVCMAWISRGARLRHVRVGLAMGLLRRAPGSFLFPFLGLPSSFHLFTLRDLSGWALEVVLGLGGLLSQILPVLCGSHVLYCSSFRRVAFCG